MLRGINRSTTERPARKNQPSTAEEEDFIQKSARLAEELEKERVRIAGRVAGYIHASSDGRVFLNEATTSSSLYLRQKTPANSTTLASSAIPSSNTPLNRDFDSDTFIIRRSGDHPGAVAFEVPSTNFYLTADLYGDDTRRDVAEVLARVPQIMADTIPFIVDFAVARPTNESNFEGSGFSYQPLRITESPHGPNKLQLFYLERYGRERFGIKTLFGSYLRCQHWEKTVSQSPHLLADEAWRFDIQH